MGPFDKITDCDIEEPAGNSGCCWLVENTVSVVNVDTASSGGTDPNQGIKKHELQIRGLVDPHAFKKLVWKMKREGHGTPSQQQFVAPANVKMSRNESQAGLMQPLMAQNKLLE